jgi:hypothetical protein
LVVPGNGLVKGIVLRVMTFFRVKTQIFDRVTTALVHCSLLGGAVFEEVGLMVLSWWC